ncbi:hypothetical protein K461DRAFT_79635 [Myriangium duriaei CBS 260.36]|uniref:Uncharacterized protein n=1 Tax=Myriangium duriaei CBS 260.36 TaxID=1168546 RepID=A0A9P4J5B9_9PEZI|nr:hypothetical protein K461DRAFT_79635 [Myriangium duriaei CBS 260.36]
MHAGIWEPREAYCTAHAAKVGYRPRGDSAVDAARAPSPSPDVVYGYPQGADRELRDVLCTMCRMERWCTTWSPQFGSWLKGGSAAKNVARAHRGALVRSKSVAARHSWHRGTGLAMLPNPDGFAWMNARRRVLLQLRYTKLISLSCPLHPHDADPVRPASAPRLPRSRPAELILVYSGKNQSC